MTRTTVLVADDHPPTRRGVRLALEGSGFSVCAEASNADAAVAEARRTRPRVCLLDIRMPGNGIAAAAAIGAELPDTAVVMLTVSRDDDDLFDALRAGASGYLLKDIAPARLPDALRQVLAGEAALPGALVARVIEEFRERRRSRRIPLVGDRPVDLTAREWEVLSLMQTGHSTAEMAERLFVTPATVRTHVHAILRKLRVRTRAEALRKISAG